MCSRGNKAGDEPRELERRFDGAMFEIYERAGRELGYWATRYLQMLRRHGGLATARRLLNTKATSDGYARLRDEARLDLTVEAHVLKPEYQSLFSAVELGMARSRLAYFNRPLEVLANPGEPVDPGLLRLLDDAAKAPADLRVEYRDRVAAFGQRAIQAMDAWVSGGGSPGFACMVLEKIGREDDPRAAVAALRRLRSRHPDWSAVIEAAITRVEAGRRA